MQNPKVFGASASQVAASSRRDQEQKRQLWVLRGVIENDFSMTILNAIAHKHARIGTIPSGYLYPELFLKERELQWGKIGADYKVIDYTHG